MYGPLSMKLRCSSKRFVYVTCYDKIKYKEQYDKYHNRFEVIAATHHPRAGMTLSAWPGADDCLHEPTYVLLRIT